MSWICPGEFGWGRELEVGWQRLKVLSNLLANISILQCHVWSKLSTAHFNTYFTIIASILDVNVVTYVYVIYIYVHTRMNHDSVCFSSSNPYLLLLLLSTGPNTQPLWGKFSRFWTDGSQARSRARKTVGRKVEEGLWLVEGRKDEQGEHGNELIAKQTKEPVKWYLWLIPVKFH